MKNCRSLGKGGHLWQMSDHFAHLIWKKMAPVSTWSAFKQGLQVPLDIFGIFDILSRGKTNPLFNQISESMKAPRY